MDGIKVPLEVNDTADMVKVLVGSLEEAVTLHVTPVAVAVASCLISLAVKLLTLMSSLNVAVKYTGKVAVEGD
jgi:hypothetical protein